MKKTIKSLVAVAAITFTVSATDAEANNLNYNYIEPTKINGYTSNISSIQASLMELGYFVGPYGITGKMNSSTRSALKQFQKDYGLKVDGIVGHETAKALNDINYSNWYYGMKTATPYNYRNYRYVPAGYHAYTNY